MILVSLKSSGRHRLFQHIVNMRKSTVSRGLAPFFKISGGCHLAQEISCSWDLWLMSSAVWISISNSLRYTFESLKPALCTYIYDRYKPRSLLICSGAPSSHYHETQALRNVKYFDCKSATPNVRWKTTSLWREFQINTASAFTKKTAGSRGGSKGGDWPLKPTKVTLFTMILYNSENSIRDIRPFCR